MSEIPDDLREKAKKLIEHWGGTSNFEYMIANFLHLERQSATKAERERCERAMTKAALAFVERVLEPSEQS